MTTSAYETAYLALRRCASYGTELSWPEKVALTTILRNCADVETACAAARTQAATLQAAIDAHTTAWNAVLAIGTIVDGTRAACVTAVDAAIVTSEALDTAWALHKAVLAQTLLATDNTAIDDLGTLTGASTSADFNTKIAVVVTSRAAANTGCNLVLDPIQAVDTVFPDTVPALTQTVNDF